MLTIAFIALQLATSDQRDELFDYVSEERESSLVITATKSLQAIEDAPAIITVLDGDLLRAQGYRTLAEALGFVAGVHVIDDYTLASAGFRGIFSTTEVANDIVKVMLNGQPTAMRPFSTTALNRALVPLSAVERIEVIRGPASALYGSNAFLGVINIVTLDDVSADRLSGGTSALLRTAIRPETGGFVGEVDLTYVARGESDLLLSLTLGSTDNSGLVAQGPEASSDLGTSNGDFDRSSSFYARWQKDVAGFELAVDSSISFLSTSTQWQAYSLLSEDSRLAAFSGWIRAGVQRSLGSNWQLDGTLTFHRVAPLPEDQIVSDPDSDVVQERRYRSNAVDAIFEVSYADQGHSLRVGLDGSLDSERLLRVPTLSTVDGSELTRGQDFGVVDFYSAGLYAQYLTELYPWLSASAGTRADYNSQIPCNDDQWDCLGRSEQDSQAGVTRTGGAIQLSSHAGLVARYRSAYAKLLFGSSFKPPSTYQLYHAPIAVETTRGEPLLQPQTADAFELQVGFSDVGGISGNLSASYTLIDDLVVFSRDRFLLRARNADAETVSLEAQLSAIIEGWKLILDGTLTPSVTIEPKQLDGESDVAWAISNFNTEIEGGRYPNWELALQAQTRFFNDSLEVAFRSRAVGQRDASLLNNQSFAFDFDTTYTADPYLYFEGRFAYEFPLFDAVERSTLALEWRRVQTDAFEPSANGPDLELPPFEVGLAWQVEL